MIGALPPLGDGPGMRRWDGPAAGAGRPAAHGREALEPAERSAVLRTTAQRAYRREG